MHVNVVASNGMPADGTDAINPVRPRAEAADQVMFHSIEKVRAALDEEPGVRAEVVERGRELMTHVQYPPAELINGLARLLAEQLRSTS